MQEEEEEEGGGGYCWAPVPALAALQRRHLLLLRTVSHPRYALLLVFSVCLKLPLFALRLN